MPRVSLAQTNFTAGEFSPRLIGRTDIDRYANGAALLQNAHPVVHGGAVRRAGSRYQLAASTSTANRSCLVPFVKGRSEAWMLEFSNNACKVLNADGTYSGVTLTTIYSDTVLDLLDYAQSDSIMYLFHPIAPIYRLQLLDGGAWALGEAPLAQVPFSEVGLAPGGTATLSAATVGVGRVLVAAAANTFLISDIGRAVTFREGIAVITSFTSDVQVTCEITRAFPSTFINAQWFIDSSPQTICTPSAKDPVGATIQLTLSTNGWRAGDVGSMVRINGGLCKIKAYTSALIVDATIIRVLSATTAAPSLAWSLEPPVWGGVFGYPRTGTVYQQRLVAAGTTKNPRTVWGSKIGEPLDFTLGTNDDDAFSFTIDSDESSPISYVSGDTDLLVLTESAEYSMRSGAEKAITPTNVRIKPESNSGCAQLRPVTARSETLFLQRAGRKIRSLAYRYENDRYNSPDLTVMAEHLTTGGVVSMAYQQEPESILWVARADGTLLSCTIDREQNIVGWARHYTEGAVESLSCIPNSGTDELWLIVRRWVNGAQVRYIEKLDHTFAPALPGAAPAASSFPPYAAAQVYGCTVDSGLAFDNAAGQTVFAVPHLIGSTVDIVADGAVQASQVVPGSGNVTLARASFRTLIGLHFQTRITPLNPEVGTGTGTAQGNSMRVGEATVRLLDTVGCAIEDSEGGQQIVPFRAFGASVLDQPPEARTENVRVSMLGWERGKSSFTIVQDQPLPLHVLAVIRKLTVND